MAKLLVDAAATRLLSILVFIMLAAYPASGQEVDDSEVESPVQLPAGLDLPQQDADGWISRVDLALENQLVLGADEGDIDALYLELDAELTTRLGLLKSSLVGATSPFDPAVTTADLPAAIQTIDDLHASIEIMYAERLRLIEFISPELQLAVTATDVYGVQQLSLELRFIWQQMRFQALSIPAAAKDLWRRIQIAPLPLIWRFLEFILAIGLFRWWRRWIPETLSRIRASLTEIRPRTSAVIRRIKLIWYIDQLRRPIEWLILFSVLFTLIHLPGLNFVRDIVAVVVRWFILGSFSVALLNAVAARGDAGLAGEYPRLRLNSLRLVAAWLVLLGLGLSLAENLSGIATLYAWVWRMIQVLAFPLLIILLSWWRKPIFRRLEREQEITESVERMLKHQTGLRSYSAAASGAVWLLANALRRSVMRNFLRIGSEQGFTSGRSAGQVETGIASGPEVDVPPLSEMLRQKLMERVEFFDRYARTERRKIIRYTTFDRGGVLAVIGERGIGKSTLFAQVSEQLGDSMICLDSISGHYKELEDNLGERLGLDFTKTGHIAQTLSDSSVRTVVIDNLHRLVRPVMGGQQELVRLTNLVEQSSASILWIFSVDRFAWQFLRRSRADQYAITEVISLPSWTEEQIGELLEQRNASAGIEADFADVRVPDEYMETSLDTVAERNQAGVYRMIGSLSGGNPSVALRIWMDCLREDEKGQISVFTPTQAPARELDSATINVLLVLRAIAQSERISERDIVDNLRLPKGAVSSATHYSLLRGWIEVVDGRYQLTWGWFRTITRVLARQNLLAR